MSFIYLLRTKPLLARPEIYQAGEYTITLDMDIDQGRTYYGCNATQHCIYLTNGTTWQDQNSRGISWEKKGYLYSISWKKENSESSDLRIFDPEGNMIFYSPLLPNF